MNRYFFILAVLSCPTIAFSQADEPNYLDPVRRLQPVPLYGADYHFTQDHASTAAEGYLRGSAAWLHSRGNYLVNERQAAILHEYVRHQQLLHKHWMAEWNDWKRERRERRIDAKREANLDTRAARYRAAYELEVTELDRATGEIRWPSALQGSEFDSSREQLEELYRRQTGNDCATPAEARAIVAECDRLIRESNRNRTRIAASDHRAAQRFLRGLKYEPLFR